MAKDGCQKFKSITIKEDFKIKKSIWSWLPNVPSVSVLKMEVVPAEHAKEFSINLSSWGEMRDSHSMSVDTFVSVLRDSDPLSSLILTNQSADLLMIYSHLHFVQPWMTVNHNGALILAIAAPAWCHHYSRTYHCSLVLIISKIYFNHGSTSLNTKEGLSDYK